MKSFVLFLVLLLSACAGVFPSGGPNGKANGAVKEQRKGKIPQPVARPAPDEAQQPVQRDPVEQPPKKREHNIEED